MSAVTLNSVLDVSHLSIQPDGEEYTVGDPVTENFIRIPYEGVAAVRLLDGSRTLGEAQAQLLDGEGIEVDFLDFGETLLELELVRSLDGLLLTSVAQVAAVRQDLGWMRPIGRLLFGKIAVGLYMLIAITSVLLFVFRPELFPQYQDFFVFPTIGMSMLVLFFVTWALLMLHECAHMLAAAASGAPVKLKLSVRWFWVVVEAEMTGLWAKARNTRYVPFFAGMFFDSTVLFLSLFLQFWLPEGGFWFRLCQMTALITLSQFLSQLMIFLRTDLYFVIITATNAANLSGDAKLYLKKTFLRSSEALCAWQTLQPREQRQATWFGVFYGLAFLVVILLIGLYMAPATWLALTQAVDEVRSEVSSPLVFWDGMLVLLLTVVQFALWVAGVWARYLRKPNARTAGM
ncbi:hypothetical protein EV586_1261 [Tumebacillus sp. BK434]|uniref:hypothetical protein n=1 Tax=Tumebacillus sp. BK434 TaxID=2512169 RepID=UPI00105214F6|nr:hypothetical protein [Tumebacillus sp. BK434]TCP49177.1 hypothetical protein EV586_1261 [Tumebacillus sp. BK434]